MNELPILILDVKTKIKHLCGGRVVQLEVDNLIPSRTVGFDDLNPHVYLRKVEFDALTRWISMQTNKESSRDRDNTMLLAGVGFSVGHPYGDPEARSELAIELMKKAGIVPDNPFVFINEEVCKHISDNLYLARARISDQHRYALIRDNRRDEGEYVQFYNTELKAYTAFSPLSKASVTMADRLMGIIAMQTAPDRGYDITLRNGIGELNILQQTDRLALSNIIEDLIR
ncbi:hypothetical protein pEaSNUABM11_00092 [Erwinia phage pEa_SNUABM_11]|nr:hypothetical protein pEaSNUABM11_00092 [Erwinia phage pEa_SNUABM_11]